MGKAQKAAQDLQSYGDQGKIQARVSDFANGLRIYESVRLVRIRSTEYTLLIMEDYFPLVGGVEGTVDIITEKEQIRLGRVKGFFMHRENEFSLLIETQLEENEDNAHDE